MTKTVATAWRRTHRNLRVALQLLLVMVVVGAGLLSWPHHARAATPERGVLDSAFGDSPGNGITRTDAGGQESGYSVALQGDRIIVGAAYQDSNGSGFLIARYLPGGKL